LERLQAILASLDGSDTEVVELAAQRAGASRASQVAMDYVVAVYLSEIAAVLQSQQERIAALEAKPAQPTKAATRRSQKK
jgi:hypothetical protein